MYCTKQKSIDTLIQKRNSKYYDVKQNLRQKPVSSIRDIRIAYKKESSVIQKAGDESEPELYQQIGPSCWLFVMEALVRHEGFDTKYLQIIMHSYESDADKIDDKRKANPEFRSRRVAALSATKDKLENFVSRLINYINNKNKNGNQGDNISKEHAENLMFKSLGNNFASKYIFSDGMNAVNCEELKAEMEKVIGKLDSLIMTAQESEHDTEDFLNTGSMQIDKDQGLKDVEDTLIWAIKPSYMSICKRYIRRKDDIGNNIDFTKRTKTELSDTAHAVLLIEYNNSDKTVKYKDPNYGDDVFKVTAEQLQWMAGEKRILIRPFFAENANKSKLADALDLHK